MAKILLEQVRKQAANTVNFTPHAKQIGSAFVSANKARTHHKTGYTGYQCPCQCLTDTGPINPWQLFMLTIIILITRMSVKS